MAAGRTPQSCAGEGDESVDGIQLPPPTENAGAQGSLATSTSSSSAVLKAGSEAGRAPTTEDPSGYGTDTDVGEELDAIVPGDEEDSLEDEGYGTSDASSFMSSILSSVRRGVQENGRTYASFGRHEYGIPMDEMELDRNDLQHHKFTLVLDNRLYAPQIPESLLEEPGCRILDLGTGTGVWAIEIADKFPSAEVIGSDIAATQPSFVPPNCVFEIEDAEDEWPYAPHYFDFIHMREFLFSIRDWPRLIQQAHNAIRPGGWIHFSGTIPEVHSDDGSMLPTAFIKQTADTFLELGELMGTPCTAPRLWKQQMIEAGFVNVEDVVIKLPISPWPKNKMLRSAGAIERHMLESGIEGMLLRGWTQILKKPQSSLTLLAELTRNELRDTSIHVYCFFHITVGQRPQLG